MIKIIHGTKSETSMKTANEIALWYSIQKEREIEVWRYEIMVYERRSYELKYDLFEIVGSEINKMKITH